MQVTCPNCGGAIVQDDVNVAKDMALCRACNQVFPFSQLTGMGMADDGDAVDLDDPPKGCLFEWSPNGFAVSGSTRSWAVAMLIPFAVAWWSFLSFFIYGFLSDFGGSGAAEAADDKSGSPMPVVVLLLFMLPFFGAGLMMVGQILLLSIGRTVVTVEAGQGCIFTGVGGFGRRKRFDWDAVARVKDMTPHNPLPVPMPMTGCITLEGKERIVFGRFLNESRRYFIVQALNRMLAQRQR